ncbi:MAG TPA: response regulator [Verrucomicrobiae bacterium]|nr:response regulator [Verrucomicrobiae bacterium]
MKGKARILIVEDEVSLACLMVTALTQAGCDVEAACTGQKAMKIAAENKFDLITLDIKLPDITGFEVCSELRKRHISRNTPIIFVSGSHSPEDMAEGKKRGAVDYIAKPFEITDFVYRIVFHARVKSPQN